MRKSETESIKSLNSNNSALGAQLVELFLTQRPRYSIKLVASARAK